MQEPLLPLFPLQAVLFPRTLLPLHIFEDRYKEMIGEAIRSEAEFGIVQASEKGIVNAGCTATVERIARKYPDGRMDIVILGRRRFELLSLNDELEYLRGVVEYFDDEDDNENPPEELRLKALDDYKIVKDASDLQVIGEPDSEDPQLSFQVAQLIPDLDFRQTLLMTRSEVERLKRFDEYIPAYLVKRKHATHVKGVAPKNGHAKVKLGGEA
jgi:hypothetical protein